MSALTKWKKESDGSALADWLQAEAELAEQVILGVAA
jgi:hypothetical protein